MTFFLSQVAFADDSFTLSPETMTVLNQYVEAYGGSSSWSWANVIGNVLFSGIGFVAFWYGRKMKSLRSVILGLVLMIFPYFVSQTLTLYVIGAILCAVLYFWRE